MLSVLGPLLSLLGLETDVITAKIRRQAIAWGLIGLLALTFVVFLLIAANSALSQLYGPVVAPLLLALGAAVIGLVVYLVARVQDGIAVKREAERRRSAETSAAITSAVLTGVPMLLQSRLMRQVGIPLGAAVAAALLIRKSGPRRPD